MWKKVISFSLATLMVLSFAACGKTQEGNTNQTGNEKEKGEKTWYFGGSGVLSGDLDYEELFKDFENTVDAEKIYSELEYTEEMLYGSYVLNNKEKDLKKVRKEIPFSAVEFTDAIYNITSFPVSVYLGKENISSSLTRYQYSEYEAIEDCELAVLEFATEEDLGTVVCSYEINGNRIKFTELNNTSGEEEEFKYQKGKAVWEYSFSVTGPYFKLSNGENSLELISYYFSENVDGDLWFTGYSILETPLIDELDYFSASDAFHYAVRRDGNYYDAFAFEIKDNGIINAYLYDKNNGEEEIFTKQYAYIINSEGVSIFNSFGIILLDGEKEYFYTDSITEREARILAEDGNVDLSEDKIEEIAEKKADLFDDLYNEFEERGINVTINRATGEMFMDSSVVFGGDSAEITEEGKELINKFLEAYTSIIFNEKYNGFVSKTRIEGHTAPIAGSTYESGLPLSEERANNVKEYCLSAETGIDLEKLAEMLEAVGYSNSKPIYGTDGNVDMNASRRVSFRFIVNIEE